MPDIGATLTPRKRLPLRLQRSKQCQIMLPNKAALAPVYVTVDVPDEGIVQCAPYALNYWQRDTYFDISARFMINSYVTKQHENPSNSIIKDKKPITSSKCVNPNKVFLRNVSLKNQQKL